MASSPMLNVLELFCGVGGMHWALKESGVDFEVKCAMDINTVTNSVYRHNFPSHYLAQREIQSLSIEELQSLSVDTILMSPPCQPFTRVGLRKDMEDQRTNAFISVLQLIERLSHPVSYIVVENVKGFEDSDTRELFIDTLNRCDYIYQEFLLTPLQFSIPNSRLRYYCIAKHKSKGDNFIFKHHPEVMHKLPAEAHSLLLCKHLYIDIDTVPDIANTSRNSVLSPEELTALIDNDERITPLRAYIEERNSDYVLDDKAMKHYQGLDIRDCNSRNSCCFTKRYGHYYVGSGSFLFTGQLLEDGRQELRYFTPEEISALMCFPEKFNFPKTVSRKQRYRALGNSLNVYVVANLIRLMVSD